MCFSFALPRAPPDSLLGCFRPGGGIDTIKFLAYQKHMAEISEKLLAKRATRDTNDAAEDTPPSKKPRGPKKICAYREEGGQLEHIKPEETVWYLLYVKGPRLDDPDFHRKFRNRFRLPYHCYQQLVNEAVTNNWFPRWARAADSKQSSPLELLILGVLRYLGRGWTFDDLEENTAISAEVHRVFFHEFVKVGSTILYDKYVRTPTNADAARAISRPYALAGLHGCKGSTDATHVTSEKIEFRLKNNHQGHKEALTARTYNLTAAHDYRILHSTKGGPCRWNDKTVILFDQFIRGMQEGNVLSDCRFNLYERRGGDIVLVPYEGAYAISDNGYLRWAATIPPFKTTSKISEIRWSRWVESIRKDVECTFGILKGRWRILKTGIRVHGVDIVDKIWLTCCALHNWLLDVDGRSQPWDGPMGYIDAEDIANLPGDIPQIIANRLQVSNLTPRNYDLSGMGPGDDTRGPVEPVAAAAAFPTINAGTASVSRGGARVVRNLDRDYFRSKLVEHFDILWSKGSIQWPRTARHPAPNMEVG